MLIDQKIQIPIPTVCLFLNISPVCSTCNRWDSTWHRSSFHQHQHYSKTCPEYSPDIFYILILYYICTYNQRKGQLELVWFGSKLKILFCFSISGKSFSCCNVECFQTLQLYKEKIFERFTVQYPKKSFSKLYSNQRKVFQTLQACKEKSFKRFRLTKKSLSNALVIQRKVFQTLYNIQRKVFQTLYNIQRKVFQTLQAYKEKSFKRFRLTKKSLSNDIVIQRKVFQTLYNIQ